MHSAPKKSKRGGQRNGKLVNTLMVVRLDCKTNISSLRLSGRPYESQSYQPVTSQLPASYQPATSQLPASSFAWKRINVPSSPIKLSQGMSHTALNETFKPILSIRVIRKRKLDKASPLWRALTSKKRSHEVITRFTKQAVSGWMLGYRGILGVGPP